jgi:hypothetical protein
MSQLSQFQSFNVDQTSLDELVALSLFGRQLRSEYEALQLEEPEWVDIQIKTLKREIHARNADSLEARRRDVNARLESLKSPGEKRQELLKEKAKLDAQLKAVGA